MGCFSGCLMSAASDQKLFCKLCSPFNCSFHEFIGEKVVSLSYSSAILTPLSHHFNYLPSLLNTPWCSPFSYLTLNLILILKILYLLPLKWFTHPFMISRSSLMLEFYSLELLALFYAHKNDSQRLWIDHGIDYMPGIQGDYSGLLLPWWYYNLFNNESGWYQILPKYQEILVIPFAIKGKDLLFIIIPLINTTDH